MRHHLGIRGRVEDEGADCCVSRASSLAVQKEFGRILHRKETIGVNNRARALVVNNKFIDHAIDERTKKLFI
jgi:hypothetical protein